MNVEEIRSYALALPGATEDMPFGPDWLVFRIEGKIFLCLCLGAAEPKCALKLPPEEGVSLRERYEGVRPAYHWNKVHWNDVYLYLLDGSLVKELIKKSYMLVRSRLPKRSRGKYAGR